MVGVPSNIGIPHSGVDFDSTRASSGAAQVPVKELVIGQRLSTGTVDEAIKFTASTAEEVAVKSGRGSMHHRQALKTFPNNTSVPVDFISLDDAATAVQRIIAFVITGTATAQGSLFIYAAGVRQEIPVPSGTTADALGDLIVAAWDLLPDLPFTSANSSGTVSTTANNGGVEAGDLDIRYNYQPGEVFPAGISVAAAAETTPGSVEPDITDAIAAIGNDWFNVIAQPYVDATNMGVMQVFLTSQNGPMVQKDSRSYQAKRDTRANMITWGETVATYNSQFMCSYPSYQRMECTYELGAGVAAAAAVSIQENPSIPLHRVKLVGFQVLDTNDTWTDTERNELALAGISTITDENGVQTEATVTMYLQNSAGAADKAYHQQNAGYQLSFGRYRWNNQIDTKYPRALLGDNADSLKPGLQIMTPDDAITEAVEWFEDGQVDGLFEGGADKVEAFVAVLQAYRPGDDNNRMNWISQPDLMNQFIVGSHIIQFLG